MEAIYSVFQNTLSPEPNTRVKAELDLKEAERQAGVLPSTLQIIQSEQADGAVKLAAAIYLKNRLRRGWEDEAESRSPAHALSDSDRSTVKSLLLPTLVTTSGQVQAHVATALNTVVRRDFPSKWPDLMDNVGRLVKSNVPNEVYGGIRALLEIVRAFRWSDEASLMEPIVEATFPTILATGNQLLASPEVDSPEVGSIIYVIVKVYKVSINKDLTQHHQANESIVPWGKFLLQVSGRNIDSSKLPSDSESRETAPWYKAKKWSCFTLNKLFSRYGNPSQLPSNLTSYKPFADRFVVMFAPEILSTYLRMTEGAISGQSWLSKKQTQFLLRYYEECIKPKSTWKLLKPHVNQLVQSFVFPRLCWQEHEEEMWELDPIEFVRMTMDPIDSNSAVESSASSFLNALVSKRTKAAFSPQLDFVTTVVQQYPATRSPAEKAGALAMCRAMDLTMIHSPKVFESLEGFFAQYVVPELASPHRFLRLRACQLVSTFASKMVWKNPKNLEATFTGVMQCATDAELPVRVEAASAATNLVEHDEVHAAMAPNAARLMQELLKLSDELELDVLSEAKSKVVEHFSEELMPFSVQLVEQMKNTYVRLLDATLANVDTAADGTHEFNLDDPEGDKAFAAMSALQTIYSVLTSCEGRPEMLADLEQSVLPLVIHTIEKEAIEFYDDCFDLVDVLTFYQKKISPGMWKVFEAMANSFLNGTGVDYLAEMLSTFDNLVSYGTDVFRQNAQYRGMLLGIYEKAMTSEQLGLGDHISACRLADVMLLLLKGSIDEHVPTIVQSVLPLLANEAKTTPALRKWAVIVVLDALVYDARLALQTLESAGATEAFFTLTLGQIVGQLSSVHQKKVAGIAFMNILSLDNAQLPSAITSGRSHLLRSLLEVLETIPAAIKRQRELEAEYEDDDEEGAESGDDSDIEGGDISSSVVNENDDDEDIQDEDNEYLELLAREGARLRAQAAAAASGDVSAASLGDDAEGDVDEEEVEDDDDDDEGVVYESPLDDVPVFEHFRQLMNHLQTAQPELLGALGTEATRRINEVGSIQDERVKEPTQEQGAAGASAGR